MIWPQARPFIAAALARDPVGRYAPEDVLRGLLNATLRLWISWDDEREEVEAAVVTEIVDYPRVRELHLFAGGGRDMKSWAEPMLNMLRDFAKDMRCEVIRGGGRQGWDRVGKSFGWLACESSMIVRL